MTSKDRGKSVTNSSGMGSRMDDFYFELTPPEGKTIKVRGGESPKEPKK